MKSVGCYGSLFPLLFMMKMMVWYFESDLIRVIIANILVEIYLFFIDMNREVWFLLYGYLDGVVVKHGNSSKHCFFSILSTWSPCLLFESLLLEIFKLGLLDPVIQLVRLNTICKQIVRSHWANVYCLYKFYLYS